MKILFWNVNNSDVLTILRELAHQHRPDIITLAECVETDFNVLIALNSGRQHQYIVAPSPVARLKHFIAMPERSFIGLVDTDKVTIRQCLGVSGEDFTLVSVHLSSKRNLSDTDQALLCTRLGKEIRSIEAKLGHRRTVVVGDLNMDPFESGVVNSEGLHAISSRVIAQRGTRTVQGEARSFFYNPMWGRLGDSTAGPPGSYYYQASSPVAYYWHTFDQVLVRAELLDKFRDESLEVICNVGGTTLEGRDGRPDVVVASDHFPITFEIDVV